MLSHVIFRNFDASEVDDEVEDRVISYMTHSDQFLPQGINSVRGIVFQNCLNTAKLAIPNCGSICGAPLETMSARMASVYDFDGSLSQTGIPSILGSHINWWDISDSTCDFIDDYFVWRCDYNQHRKVAYLTVFVTGIYEGCDDNSPLMASGDSCSGQNTPYTVGYMSQFGVDKKILLSPWAGVAGQANIGWYWRAPWGAPSSFRIGEQVQIPRGHFILVAVRYPPTATFTVNLVSAWWSVDYAAMPMSSKSDIFAQVETIGDPDTFTCTGEWYDFCTDFGSVGPAWHWDGEYLYLRVVNFFCYNTNGKDKCDQYYEVDEMRLWDITGAFYMNVEVTCPGCNVENSYSGIDYWTVADVNVPTVWNQLEENVPAFVEDMTTIRSTQTDPTSPADTTRTSRTTMTYSSSGNTGTDNTGTDNTGTGNTGTGNTGTGKTGTGTDKTSEPDDNHSESSRFIIALFAIFLALIL